MSPDRCCTPLLLVVAVILGSLTAATAVGEPGSQESSEDAQEQEPATADSEQEPATSDAQQESATADSEQKPMAADAQQEPEAEAAEQPGEGEEIPQNEGPDPDAMKAKLEGEYLAACKKTNGDTALLFADFFDRYQPKPGSLGFLPEELSLLKKIDFVDLGRLFETCQEAAAALQGSGGEMSEGETSMLASVTRSREAAGMILTYYASEQKLRDLFLQYTGRLRSVRQLTVRREEWPSEELCSDCSRSWKSVWKLRQVMAIAERVQPRLEEETLAAAIKSIGGLHATGKRLCGPATEVMALDLGSMDRDYRYYSWTQTRRSVDSIQAIVKKSDLGKWCKSQ